MTVAGDTGGARAFAPGRRLLARLDSVQAPRRRTAVVVRERRRPKLLAASTRLARRAPAPEPPPLIPYSPSAVASLSDGWGPPMTSDYGAPALEVARAARVPPASRTAPATEATPRGDAGPDPLVGPPRVAANSPGAMAFAQAVGAEVSDGPLVDSVPLARAPLPPALQRASPGAVEWMMGGALPSSQPASSGNLPSELVRSKERAARAELMRAALPVRRGVVHEGSEPLRPPARGSAPDSAVSPAPAAAQPNPDPSGENAEESSARSGAAPASVGGRGNGGPGGTEPNTAVVRAGDSESFEAEPPRPDFASGEVARAPDLLVATAASPSPPESQAEPSPTSSEGGTEAGGADGSEGVSPDIATRDVARTMSARVDGTEVRYRPDDLGGSTEATKKAGSPVQAITDAEHPEGSAAARADSQATVDATTGSPTSVPTAHRVARAVGPAAPVETNETPTTLSANQIAKDPSPTAPDADSRATIAKPLARNASPLTPTAAAADSGGTLATVEIPAMTDNAVSVAPAPAPPASGGAGSVVARSPAAADAFAPESDAVPIVSGSTHGAEQRPTEESPTIAVRVAVPAWEPVRSNPPVASPTPTSPTPDGGVVSTASGEMNGAALLPPTPAASRATEETSDESPPAATGDGARPETASVARSRSIPVASRPVSNRVSSIEDAGASVAAVARSDLTPSADGVRDVAAATTVPAPAAASPGPGSAASPIARARSRPIDWPSEDDATSAALARAPEIERARPEATSSMADHGAASASLATRLSAHASKPRLRSPALGLGRKPPASGPAADGESQPTSANDDLSASIEDAAPPGAALVRSALTPSVGGVPDVAAAATVLAPAAAGPEPRSAASPIARARSRSIDWPSEDDATSAPLARSPETDSNEAGDATVARTRSTPVASRPESDRVSSVNGASREAEQAPAEATRSVADRGAASASSASGMGADARKPGLTSPASSVGRKPTASEPAAAAESQPRLANDDLSASTEDATPPGVAIARSGPTPSPDAHSDEAWSRNRPYRTLSRPAFDAAPRDAHPVVTARPPLLRLTARPAARAAADPAQPPNSAQPAQPASLAQASAPVAPATIDGFAITALPAAPPVAHAPAVRPPASPAKLQRLTSRPRPSSQHALARQTAPAPDRAATQLAVARETLPTEPDRGPDATADYSPPLFLSPPPTASPSEPLTQPAPGPAGDIDVLFDALLERLRRELLLERERSGSLFGL